MRRADAPRPRAVQLLATCLVDHLYPRVGLAVADVLERAGLEVVVPEGQTCCGFGGLFSVKMSAISGAMLERKLDAIAASGASTVVATDVSCLMHIAGGLRRRGSTVGVRHLAEVLADTGARVEPEPTR